MRSQTETILTLEAIEHFLSSLSDKGRSPQTTKAYGSDLREFLKWVSANTHEKRVSLVPGADMSVTESFEVTAMRWLQSQRTIVAPKTTGRRLSSLRSFARWAGYGLVLEDYSPPEAARALPHPIPEGMPGVRRMIEVARGPHQAALVAFGGFVGCRVAETLAIRPADFNFTEMTLEIRGKGDKRRIVPVSPEAWTVVQRAVLDGAVKSMTEPIMPFKDRFARKIVTTLGARAELSRHVSSHDLRATFATELHDRTKNIRLVQELLGHASVTTTELYTAVRLDSMREAVRML